MIDREPAKIGKLKKHFSIGQSNMAREMQRVCVEEYPEKGVVLEMGTHSLYPKT